MPQARLNFYIRVKIFHQNNLAYRFHLNCWSSKEDVLSMVSMPVKQNCNEERHSLQHLQNSGNAQSLTKVSTTTHSQSLFSTYESKKLQNS